MTSIAMWRSSIGGEEPDRCLSEAAEALAVENWAKSGVHTEMQRQVRVSHRGDPAK